MADLFLAIEFEAEQEGLSEFSSALHKIKFPHRLSEHKNGFALWVYHEQHVATANELYQRYINNTLPEVQVEKPVSAVNTRQLTGYLRLYPITLLLILGSIIGFISIKLQWIAIIELFSFQGFGLSGVVIDINSPVVAMQQIQSGEIWRLFTPVFLHFDFMHIAFNMVLLWFFANQIERVEGRLLILVYAGVTGVASNTVQFLMSPESLFGGMSGVNYGLLAYCCLINYLSKKTLYHYPSGFLWFAIVMMMLGFLGVFSLFGYGIANWAHLAGLVAGFGLALVSYYKNRSQVS